MDSSFSLRAQKVLDDFIAGDLYTVQVVGAVIIGLLIIVLIFFTSGKSTKKHVLFCGLCDSGKTSLFVKLTADQVMQTYTSIKENVASFSTNSNQILELVDLPGHEKVRYHLLEKYRDSARAVVFVLDSNTINKEIKDAAEYFHTLITDPVLHSSRTPILLLCHKSDGVMAKSPDAVQSILEREITTLRRSSLSSLSSTDSSSRVTQKYDNSEFSFSSHKPHKISFGSSHVTKGDSNVEELQQWMAKI